MKRLIIPLLCIPFLAGCTHAMKFRVVDEDSGKPITAATARLTKVDYRFLMDREERNMERRMTDTEGSVSVSGVRQAHDYVLIEAPGYLNARAGLIGDGKVGLVSPYPPLDPNPDTHYLNQKRMAKDIIVVVPLKRR